MALTDPLDDALYSSTALQWAEDPTYVAAGDARDGTPTKVTPSLALIRQGVRPERQQAAQFHNAVLNVFARTLLRLRTDLIGTREDASDALDSLNAIVAEDERRLLVGGAALSFGRPFTDMGDLRFAAYDQANRLWYVCGGAKNVHSSRDFGGWFGANEIAAVGPGSEDCAWIDFDASGNVVVATATQYVFEKTASTGAWTRVAVAGNQAGAVAFDPVRARWCHVSGDGGSGLATVHTSLDRMTWTQGTRPTGFLATDGSKQVLANKTTGRLTWTCFAAGGTTIKVATSDDGGSTWTRRADLVTTFTPQDVHLSRGDGNTWWLAVSRFSGGYQSEVWRSEDDGATWTKRCTLASARVLRIAQVDSVLVSVASRSLPGAAVAEEVVYSLDDGATWLPAGLRPMGSTALGCFSGPNVGGVFVCTSTHAYHSGRTRLPSWTPLT